MNSQNQDVSPTGIIDGVPMGDDISNMGGPALLRELLLYIHAHYKQHLTLHDLADYANMSDASVSRYIKKHTGKNFEDYLRDIKLCEAIRLLIHTNRQITDIALEQGFSSPSAFNKSFRAVFGMAPGQYRKLYSGGNKAAQAPTFRTPTTQPAHAPTFRTPITQPENAKDDVLVSIRANINKSTPYTPPALKAVNMGNAAGLRHMKQQRQLLFLVRDIGFKYVRICNIFSEEMEYRNSHMCTSLNFDLIDEVLETILNAGCIPFIDLAEKPRIVKKNIYETLLNKKEGFFKSEGEENAVIDAFFRHLISRFGRNKLDLWLFEYWYDRIHDDPDGGLSTYFNSFDRVCAILKKYLPQAAMGGCGLPLVDFDMDRVLKDWAHHPFHPDFLSFEYYPYNGRDLARPLQWMTAWMTSPDHINREVENILALSGKYFGRRLPVFINEWNMSLSSRNYFNDTCAKAALLSNYICNLSTHITMLAYCAGSDSAGRAYDYAQTFCGGNGLITKDGVPKPVYYVFSFLKEMGSRCFARGKGYQITGTLSESFMPLDASKHSQADSEESSKILEGCEILCCHPGTFSWNFTEKSEDEINVDNVDTVFTTEGSRNLSIRLSGILSGAYTITRYSINNADNNVLEQWKAVRTLEPLNDATLDYLKAITRPRMKARAVHIDCGRLELEEKLNLNETVFIKIRRQQTFCNN